jgi:hypothetical protein
MSDELKPCPFCGREMDTVLRTPYGRPSYRVLVCRTDGCTAQNVYFDCNDTWNTRPIEDALRARIQELLLENERLRVELSQKVL